MTLPRWFYVSGIILVLVGLGYWFFGRASTEPVTDAEGNPVIGSIASLEKIKLGGVDQWLTIRGYNAGNPVLLFLSGGPGASELGRVRYFSEPLEEHFTLVVWEQRGAGKSFPSVRPKEDVTVEQYTAEDSGHDMLFQETQKFHDLMINTVLPETHEQAVASYE